MSKLITIPAILMNVVGLRDKSLKVVIHTQEVTPESAGALYGNISGYGYFAWKPEGFDPTEEQMLEALRADKFEGRKSQAQRLRAVLYRVWQQNPEGMNEMQHYDHYMETIINHFKGKLT